MHTLNFQDVLLAKRQIRPYLPRTPLHSYPAIYTLLGTETYIKEDWTPVKIGE
jgi:threonine dehydratase